MAAYLAVDPPTLAMVLGAFLLGGLVKGGLGFGLPLVTMSILPLLIPIEAALALNAVILPLSNVTQFVGERAMKETFVRFRPLLVGLVIGIPIGAAFVKYVDDAVLMTGLGVFVVLFSLFAAYTPTYRIPESAQRRIAVWVGVGIGLIGSLTTASGPVCVMYLVGLNLERGMFRSVLGLMFIISGVLIVGSFWALNIVTLPRLVLGVLCIVPTTVGMWAGNRLAGRMSSSGFRRLVLFGLVVLGANLVYRGAAGG